MRVGWEYLAVDKLREADHVRHLHCKPALAFAHSSNADGVEQLGNTQACGHGHVASGVRAAQTCQRP